MDCGRTVFIARSDQIQAEYRFLDKHYYTKHFYVGDQILLDVPFGWSFFEIKFSKVPKYFKDVFETGIYGKLKKKRRGG